MNQKNEKQQQQQNEQKSPEVLLSKYQRRKFWLFYGYWRLFMVILWLFYDY